MGAGAAAVCAGAAGVGSIGAGTVAAGAEAAGAVSIGAWAVVCAGAVVAGTGAFREGLGLEGAAVATFIGGSLDLAGGASAEVLPFVLVSATFASDFTGVAVARDAVAGLSGDDVARSSTNAPPITTAVIAPNAMPK